MSYTIKLGWSVSHSPGEAEREDPVLSTFDRKAEPGIADLSRAEIAQASGLLLRSYGCFTNLFPLRFLLVYLFEICWRDS